MAAFETKQLSREADAIAPDGSEVRLLCQAPRGSMAQFSLPPHVVSKPVAHRTVQEVWYFVSGRGRMWRRLGADEEVVEVGAGTSINIPVGTSFQFRSTSDEPLVAIGTTMPPWPGGAEAYEVEGLWPPTIGQQDQ